MKTPNLKKMSLARISPCTRFGSTVADEESRLSYRSEVGLPKWRFVNVRQQESTVAFVGGVGRHWTSFALQEDAKESAVLRALCTLSLTLDRSEEIEAIGETLQTTCSLPQTSVIAQERKT
jgi:hypothetical protein